MKLPRASAASLLSIFATPVFIFAQAPPINYQSTEIHPDHTITFRYKDPGATKVLLNIRDLPKPMEMEKGIATESRSRDFSRHADLSLPITGAQRAASCLLSVCNSDSIAKGAGSERVLTHYKKSPVRM